ncbi:hypothetical protein [Microcystis phage Mel-JY03]
MPIFENNEVGSSVRAKINAAITLGERLQAGAGGVSLYELGYAPADGDVRTMITAALAVGRSREVIIPYNAAPWFSLGEMVIPAGVTITFEPGARIAQNHSAVPGIRLQAGARLVRPYLTSTVHTRTSMAGAGVPEQTSYQHNARAIFIDGADAAVLDVQMLEYMAGGIVVNAADAVVTNLTARHLRSYSGYAAAIDAKFNADRFYITVNNVSDCDRALEPEDGANGRFVAAPGVLERIASGYYHDANNPVSESFCLSVHSHNDDAAFKPCNGVVFAGSWTCIDCIQPVYFDHSLVIANSDDYRPLNCHVEEVTIIVTPAYDHAYPRQRTMVMLNGYGCSVKARFVLEAGATMPATFQSVMDVGANNRIELVGPDINMAIPWGDIRVGSVDCEYTVTATRVTTQPTVPANAGEDHLILLRGAGGRLVRSQITGVQHRGYVRVDSTAAGFRVQNCVFRMPTANAPAAAIRLNGGDDGIISENAYTDTSNLSQFVRGLSTTTRTLVTGNALIRTGAAIVLDSGTAGITVVNNQLGAATITNSGTNTVTPNY